MNRIKKVENLIKKTRESHTSITYTYNLIVEADFQDKYILALQILNNAEMLKIDAENYYYANEEDLEREEFIKFFKAFSDYRIELLDVISEKDENTTYMLPKLEALDSSRKNIEDLLNNYRIQEEENNRKRENYKNEDLKGLFGKK